jgi:Xaa-Pro aminopeptidase
MTGGDRVVRVRSAWRRGSARGRERVTAAELIVAGSEHDANMLYASGFVAGDPFIWLRVDGRSTLVMSDLELGRARDESRADEIVAYGEIERRLQRGKKRPSQAKVIAAALAERGARSAAVPWNFPSSLAEDLRGLGVRLEVRRGVFFPERQRKRPEEVAAIEEAQRACEAAVEKAFDLLRRAKERRGRLVAGGEVVTSELLKRAIHRELMERDCVGVRTIVSAGDQGCDPHCTGTGPVAAGQSIIFDVFPRSAKTLYFADMTRTVVKGRPSRELRRMYDDVLEAQELGESMVRAGASGLGAHEAVQRFFRRRGWRTEPRDGKWVGYFHGLGHGVGLDIHEAPWLTRNGTELVEGAVVTVEPGLYYFGVGGVRLEDMVVVEKRGSRNLTRFEKRLAVE